MSNLAFFDGKFISQRTATIPLATHALHYGTGCFEGIRGYWNQNQQRLFLFRLEDHYRRLTNSCKTLHIKPPGTIKWLCDTTIELVQRNGFKEGIYIRPIVFKSAQTVTAFVLDDLADSFAIFALPLGSMADTTKGIKMITSSWIRQNARMIPPSAKPTGIYLNTCLAKTEAHAKGADDAIMLNLDGSVAEASAANLFLVKNKKLITPSTDQNILDGITRRTIIEITDLSTVERKVPKEELLTADEIFICGTGLEVTPVIEIDGWRINDGRVGETTKKLQSLYFNIVMGNNTKYKNWLTKV